LSAPYLPSRAVPVTGCSLEIGTVLNSARRVTSTALTFWPPRPATGQSARGGDFRGLSELVCVNRSSTPMLRMSTISIIVVILSAATAEAQNYPPFLREAEQALANEFRQLEHQDWQEWRQQQEWRLRQADDEDDATCWRLQDYYPYSDCRAKLLATRQECARGGDFFDSDCE